MVVLVWFCLFVLCGSAVCVPFAFAVGGNVVFDKVVNVGAEVLISAVVVGVAVDVLVAFADFAICC